MNTLEGLPILDHYNHLLATGKQQHAWLIMQEFYEFFTEDSPREHLWYILVMALRSDNDEIEARQRGNMIFFYEYSIVLFKAAYVLYKEQKSKAPRKKRK